MGLHARHFNKNYSNYGHPRAQTKQARNQVVRKGGSACSKILQPLLAPPLINKIRFVAPSLTILTGFGPETKKCQNKHFVVSGRVIKYQEEQERSWALGNTLIYLYYSASFVKNCLFKEN